MTPATGFCSGLLLTVRRPSDTVPTNLEMVMGQAMTAMEGMRYRWESLRKGTRDRPRDFITWSSIAEEVGREVWESLWGGDDVHAPSNQRLHVVHRVVLQE